MLMLSVFTVIVHAYIVAKGATFFRIGGDVRESDKSLVASLMALSTLFVIAQAAVWVEQPWRMMSGSMGGVLFMAFIFAESFLNLALVTILTGRREESECSARRR